MFAYIQLSFYFQVREDSILNQAQNKIVLALNLWLWLLAFFVCSQPDASLIRSTVGCFKLPKVLFCIIPPPYLVPIPKNVSPSEKKFNFLHDQGPATQFEVLQHSDSKGNLIRWTFCPNNVLAIDPNASIYHRDVPWCPQNVSPSEKTKKIYRFKVKPLSFKFYSIAIVKEI